MPINVEPKVTIIVLNWNSFPDTVESLRSLTNLDYGNASIVVVDNGSTDGSAEKLKENFSDIHLTRNRENLGVAGGRNVRLRWALDHSAEYILLTDNDCVFESDVLSLLIQVAESDNQIGAVGPKILEYYNVGGEFPLRVEKLYSLWGTWPTLVKDK